MVTVHYLYLRCRVTNARDLSCGGGISAGLYGAAPPAVPPAAADDDDYDYDDRYGDREPGKPLRNIGEHCRNKIKTI